MFRRMGPQALFLILLFRIHSALRDVFRVTGPEAPVIAMLGGVAVLECQLIPERPPNGMELQWARSDSERHTPIHRYIFGQDVEEQLTDAYRGRTEFYKDEFNQGNVSLKLKNVRLQDEGSYLCMVEHENIIQQTSIKLQVASFGDRPAIRLDGYRADGIGLQCDSSSWYPAPALYWTDENGKDVTDEATTKPVQSTGGLYSISSTIEVTGVSASSNFKCLVNSNILKHSQESSLRIPDEFFPRMSKFFTVFILFLIVLLGLMAGAGYYQFRKWTDMKELRSRPALEKFKSVMELQEVLKGNVDNAEANLFREKMLSKIAAERVITAAVPVTFDPKTANPYLKVLEDRLTVIFNDDWQELPQSSKRFNSRLFVMAKEGYKTGSQYWEVLVGNKPDWDLGVVRESIPRDDWVTLSPENGYWTIGKRGDSYEANLTSPESITCNSSAQRIGIYLNCEDGVVRFYNADDMVQIYNFSATFTEKIYPFFSPWGSREVMKICPL